MAQVQVINGVLQLTGQLAGAVQIGAQTLAGNLTILLPNSAPLEGQLVYVRSVNGNQVILDWVVADQATGSVSSVGVSVPAELTVSGSPVTSSGVIALGWASASGNKVIASPANGSSGPYAGRAIVAADIPSLPYLAVTGGSTVAAFSFTAATGINLVNSTSGDIDITQSGSGIILISGPNASSVRLASNGMLLTPGTGQFTTIRSPRFSGEVLDNTVTGAAHAGQVLAADNANGNLVWSDSIVATSLSATTGIDLTISAAGTNGVTITTATGVFEFFGTGGGMALQSQNANFEIDTSGNASIAAGNPGAGITLTPNASGLILLAGNTAIHGALDLSHAGNHIGANTDISGVATLTTSTSVAVVFGTPYVGSNAPQVVVTAVGADPTALGGVWITNQGSSNNWTGFTINVTNSGSALFNYTVLGN